MDRIKLEIIGNNDLRNNYAIADEWRNNIDKVRNAKK